MVLQRPGRQAGPYLPEKRNVLEAVRIARSNTDHAAEGHGEIRDEIHAWRTGKKDHADHAVFADVEVP